MLAAYTEMLMFLCQWFCLQILWVWSRYTTTAKRVLVDSLSELLSEAAISLQATIPTYMHAFQAPTTVLLWHMQSSHYSTFHGTTSAACRMVAPYHHFHDLWMLELMQQLCEELEWTSYRLPGWKPAPDSGEKFGVDYVPELAAVGLALQQVAAQRRSLSAPVRSR